MTRYSENYVIIKKDLENGLIKKREYKGLVEYWVYRGKESHIFQLDGSRAKLGNLEDAGLHCIIACEKNHISKKKKDAILIKGYRFTEKDLDDYLRKTRRGKNG